jgi:hypothetical protein
MSKFRPITRRSAAEPEEVALTPQQQRALQSGLTGLQVPQTDAGFNQQLFNSLFSGREPRPWCVPVAERLPRMALPLVIGFGLTLTLARHYDADINSTKREALPSEMPTGIVIKTPDSPAVAPPLPPLPRDIAPPLVWLVTVPQMQPVGKVTHERAVGPYHVIATHGVEMGEEAHYESR